MLPGCAQDLADLLDESFDAVADTTLPEPAEAAEVAPDLGRVHVRPVGKLLRRDRLLAHLAGLCQDLQVARKAGCDPERQTLLPVRRSIGVSGRRHGVQC